jgi:hypothetical protein
MSQAFSSIKSAPSRGSPVEPSLGVIDVTVKYGGTDEPHANATLLTPTTIAIITTLISLCMRRRSATIVPIEIVV